VKGRREEKSGRRELLEKLVTLPATTEFEEQHNGRWEKRY